MICKMCRVSLSFYVGSGVQDEWVVGGGGWCGYFWEELESINALKDLTTDALTISAVSLDQKGTAKRKIRIGNGGYDISVGGTYRSTRVAMDGLNDEF